MEREINKIKVNHRGRFKTSNLHYKKLETKKKQKQNDTQIGRQRTVPIKKRKRDV